MRDEEKKIALGVAFGLFAYNQGMGVYPSLGAGVLSWLAIDKLFPATRGGRSQPSDRQTILSAVQRGDPTQLRAGIQESNLTMAGWGNDWKEVGGQLGGTLPLQS